MQWRNRRVSSITVLLELSYKAQMPKAMIWHKYLSEWTIKRYCTCQL